MLRGASLPAEDRLVAFFMGFSSYVEDVQRRQVPQIREEHSRLVAQLREERPSGRGGKTAVFLGLILLNWMDSLRDRGLPSGPPAQEAPVSAGVTAWLQAREGRPPATTGRQSPLIKAWLLGQAALKRPVDPSRISSGTLDEITRFIEERGGVSAGHSHDSEPQPSSSRR
jgi:hypothetical protein